MGERTGIVRGQDSRGECDCPQNFGYRMGESRMQNDDLYVRGEPWPRSKPLPEIKIDGKVWQEEESETEIERSGCCLYCSDCGNDLLADEKCWGICIPCKAERVARYTKPLSEVIEHPRYCEDCGRERYSSNGCSRCGVEDKTESGTQFVIDYAELDESEGGAKFDDDKPPLELLDRYALEQIALVLKYGAEKYDANNWRKGLKLSRLTGAAMRHIIAYNDGETLDEETNLSHLAHAGCMIMFALWMHVNRSDLDDRWDKDDA